MHGRGHPGFALAQRRRRQAGLRQAGLRSKRSDPGRPSARAPTQRARRVRAATATPPRAGEARVHEPARQRLRAGDHGPDQVLLQRQQVVQDGGDVDADQRPQRPAVAAVEPGDAVGEVLADQPDQRPLGDDVVVGEQAGARLHQQQRQQRDDRPAAERVVPDVDLLRAPAQVLHVREHRAGAAHEAREARVPGPGEAPGNAEEHQREDRVAGAHVPHLGVAADLDGDHRDRHQRHQRPVERADRPVPDTDADRLAGLRAPGLAHRTRSMTSAIPCPTPMHMVASA